MPKPYKTMTKFYPEKINHFERKDTNDKSKDCLLGIDSRLQEVFRAKFGLVPFKERHCHGEMTMSILLVCIGIIMSGIGERSLTLKCVLCPPFWMLAQVIGVPVVRLAMMLVATINVIIFSIFHFFLRRDLFS